MRDIWLLLPLLVGCIPAGGSGGDIDATTPPDARVDAGRLLLDGAPLPTDADPGGEADAAAASDAVANDGGALDGAALLDGPAPDMPRGPPPPECDDGEDNDGDGLFDLDDGDCTSSSDPREMGDFAGAACANGVDDDEDGQIDFPTDPGCAGAGDDSEADTVFEPECVDAADNDGDGLIDYPDDPGCQGRGDGTEADPPRPPACANGIDDDGDGAIDHPDDDGCAAAGDFSEIGPCGEGADVVDLARNGIHDGDLTDAPARFTGSCGGAAGGERIFRYTVDHPLERLVVSTVHAETEWPVVVYVRRACGAEADIACARGPNQMQPGATIVLPDPEPTTYYIVVDTGSRNGVGRFRLSVEEVEIPQCRDGVDNDEDALVDNADPGCTEGDDVDEADPDEAPVCSDGEDNDGDGAVDYPDDEDCLFAGAAMEGPICPEGPPIIEVGQDGGAFPLPAAVGLGGSTPSCDGGRSAEAVLMIDLELPSDVVVQVNDAGMPARLTLHARTDCHDPESEIGCRRAADFADTLTLEAVPRGRYFVLVELNFVPAGIERIAVVDIQSVITECNDEVDNDGDGRVDLADPGCEQPRDPSEADPAEPPECADLIDNDGDDLADFPDDPGCDAAGDDDEADWRAPAVGLEGNFGVNMGDNWIVCRADEASAWIAANSSGNYQATAICQHLGYARADQWGGTCGTVCGFCGQAGVERYDNNGGGPDALGATVHWHCIRNG